MLNSAAANLKLGFGYLFGSQCSLGLIDIIQTYSMYDRPCVVNST